MTLEEIKENISKLAARHRSEEDILGDGRDDEYTESTAFDMIIAYSETKGYEINGFPQLKKKEAEIDEDYFCMDRYRYYIDLLTLEKEDIAELNWHYYSSFWPNQFENKEEFIETVKNWVKSGENFYGLSI